MDRSLFCKNSRQLSRELVHLTLWLRRSAYRTYSLAPTFLSILPTFNLLYLDEANSLFLLPFQKHRSSTSTCLANWHKTRLPTFASLSSLFRQSSWIVCNWYNRYHWRIVECCTCEYTLIVYKRYTKNTLNGFENMRYECREHNTDFFVLSLMR